MVDHGDGNGLDPTRWWVGAGVATKLALEAEVDATRGIEARVRGPQSGKALADCTEGVLHSARPDLPVAGGDSAITVALAKDLEKQDGVIDGGEGGVGAKGITEVMPDGPDAILCAGARRNDAGIEGCPQQAEIRADFISGWRRHKRQGSCCGYVALK
jgi:hypothetical protein